MRGRPRVVRVVDDAGDAGVDAAKRRDEVADVVVVRTVIPREPVVRGRHVLADRAVRNDPSELPFPRVPVRIDESWNDDRVGRVDHLGVRRRLELAAPSDADDLFPFDQHVAADEISDRLIHREDGAASEEHVLRWPDWLTRSAVKRPGIVCRLRCLGENLCGRKRSHGAHEQCSARLDDIATFHESPPTEQLGEYYSVYRETILDLRKHLPRGIVLTTRSEP